MVGDKVVLNPVNSGQPLHASSSLLIDHPNCQEVRHLTPFTVVVKFVISKRFLDDTHLVTAASNPITSDCVCD